MNGTILTLGLIIVNVLIYGYQTLISESIVNFGANFGPLTLSGEWWRLFTCMFLHGNLMHIFANMLALWNLGIVVESSLGRFAFSVIYLLAGLSGSLMSVYWHPRDVSLGASGAIFGIFGALIGMLIRRSFMTGIPLSKEVLRSVMINILLNLGISMLPGIDLAAHAGGMVVGFVLGMIIDPYPSTRSWWQHPIMVLLFGSIGIYFAYGYVQETVLGNL